MYDDMVLEIDDTYVKYLSDFAIAVMTVARKAEPSNADCWNVCLISFDGLQPSFIYGGCTDDVAYDNTEGPAFYVRHPTQIKAKKKK